MLSSALWVWICMCSAWECKPPIPPPKPAHLMKGYFPPPQPSPILISNTSTEPTNGSILLAEPHAQISPPPVPLRVESSALSFLRETQEAEPRTCPINPGKETAIEIVKEKMGLGLSIVGGSDTPLGTIIIHEVYPEGAAALDGRLKPGDQILEVNSEDLRSAPHERAITALRQTPAIIRMTVYREEGFVHEEDIYDVMEVELYKKPGRGLGLSIVSRKNGPGVYISEVVKGGVAEADGRLMQGDQILEVNGQDLKNASQEYAAAVLKTTMGRINMKIGRLKAGTRRSTSSNVSSPKSVDTSDGEGQCKSIILEKDEEGLGFSIVGGCGSVHGDLPIYVKCVFDTGPAARSGQLKHGDQIIAVNNQSLEGLAQEEVVNILKSVQGTVTLTVIS